MILFDTDYIKNQMLLVAYQEAHKRINEIVEKPKRVYDRISFDDDFTGEDLTDVLFDVLVSIPLEIEDSSKDYMYLVNDILDSVHQTTYTCMQVVVHFGLLIDYKHLFTREEQRYWENRMIDLFEDFCPSVCRSLEDYVYSWFGEDEQDISVQEYYMRSNYTFVFSVNPEIHDANSFNTSFWNTLVVFTEEYYRFYEDLIAEIKKRKRD